MRKSKQGFTLVEIMIVVVIIGLLVMMAVPMWQKIRLRSQNETILNNLRQIESAAQQYFLERGAATVALTELIGTDSDKYIKSVAPVRDEVYPATIAASDVYLTATSAVADVTYPP